ncbi:MAG TPA: hypothetical protein DDW84_05850 [Phycisphaerales bacterium]|nr:MAG: hypothetical protein A2Y13_10705 [Planctomycetes bacterium GWC2_45_44]HBG78356.1 hypothetical protein [Phycisphaerales bacterium]HBR19928.1 hypothetical protein [Phycisphaerales bacterium]
MKSIEKGTIIELEVQYLLVKKGLQVFSPVNEGCKVDLIFIDKNNVPKRVQTKKCKPTTCGFAIDLRFNINRTRTQKGRYTVNDIDFFATTHEGELYLIPIEVVTNRSIIVLRLNEKYKNQNKSFYAKDFEIH